MPTHVDADFLFLSRLLSRALALARENATEADSHSGIGGLIPGRTSATSGQSPYRLHLLGSAHVIEALPQSMAQHLPTSGAHFSVLHRFWKIDVRADRFHGVATSFCWEWKGYYVLESGWS